MTRLRQDGFAGAGPAILMLLALTIPAAAKTICRPGVGFGGGVGWWPQTAMTSYGETRYCVFHRWPKGDPPIDWSKTRSPIVSPQTRILKKVTP